MKRVKLWSESAGLGVILRCFQWEALTLTNEVSQPLLPGVLEKWWVNLIQSKSTRKYSKSPGNSVSHLMGININSLDAVSWSVYLLHNCEGINLHFCMLPVTSILSPPLHLTVIVYQHGHSDQLVGRMSWPNSKLTSQKEKSHASCTVAAVQGIRMDYMGWVRREKEEERTAAAALNELRLIVKLSSE